METSKIWLREGKQSKETRLVKELASGFAGSDFEKIRSILRWMEKNLKSRRGSEVQKIFATRTVTTVIKDRFSTGCHDDALVFAALCRVVGIPAKYVVGINKLDPKNRGHCVVETYMNGSWVLVDQSRGVIWLSPERSDFYKENFIVGEGLDSWDVGIRSFRSWRGKSNRVVEVISKIEGKKSELPHAKDSSLCR